MGHITQAKQLLENDMNDYIRPQALIKPDLCEHDWFIKNRWRYVAELIFSTEVNIDVPVQCSRCGKDGKLIFVPTVVRGEEE